MPDPLFEFAPAALLAVEKYETNVVVRWSASVIGHQVHTSSSLPGSWSPVEGTPAVAHGWQSLVVPVEASAQFFRLQQ